MVLDKCHNEIKISHEHLSRNNVPQSCNINICADNQVLFRRDFFLNNTENKTGLIGFLFLHLCEKGISSSIISIITIAETALEIAQKNMEPIKIVAYGTNIAVMFIHHLQKKMTEVYFLQE